MRSAGSIRRYCILLVGSTCVSIVLAACRVHPGSNHLLFVSKANSGLDVDSMPATAEVSVFGHSDTVLGPTFENAKSAPVIASFQRSHGLSDGWPFTGSTVVTGPAAMAVASGWVMATETGNPASVGPSLDVLAGMSNVSLSGVPNVQDRNKQMYVAGDAPPTWFSSSEGFGIELELHGPFAPLAESFHAGYRRKESLIVPLSMSADENDDKNQVVVHTPSVLNVTRMVPVREDGQLYRPHCSCHKKLRPRKLKQRRVQLFATGRAATMLAGSSAIQEAVLDGFIKPECEEGGDHTTNEDENVGDAASIE